MLLSLSGYLALSEQGMSNIVMQSTEAENCWAYEPDLSFEQRIKAAQSMVPCKKVLMVFIRLWQPMRMILYE